MNVEGNDLLEQARRSLEAAKVLYDTGYYGFAASRAYYAMFYVAEALLLSKGLSFSKHAAVQSEFGKVFVKTGIVPAEYHRDLILAMEVRHAGDYGDLDCVSEEECGKQIERAHKFMAFAEKYFSTSE